MNKRALTVAGAAAAGAICWWFFAPQKEAAPEALATGGQIEPEKAALPYKAPLVEAKPPAVPQAPAVIEASRAPSPEKPAATPMVAASAGLLPEQKEPADVSEVARDIDRLQLMFRDYRTLMGGNPVGTNAEIMKSIMGGNPRQATLGPPEGQGLNADGELVDRWGTPYFFHQLSGIQMEIRSAGPDKKMGTSDDTVAR